MLLTIIGVFSAAPAFAKTTPSQPTDPNANSPAGVVYAIPIESSRQDASPHGHTSQGAGGSGGSGNSGTGGSVNSGSGGSGNSGTGGSGNSGSGGSAAGSGSGGGGSTPGGSGSGGSGSAGSGSGSGGSGGGKLGSGSSGSGSKAGGSGTGGSGSHSGLVGHSSGSVMLVPGGQPGSLIHSENGFGSSSDVPGLNAKASAGLAAVQGDGSSAPSAAIVLAIVVLAVGSVAGAGAWRRSTRRHRRASTGSR
jgi:hypothetical protein